jgi:hypothetical protein
VLLVKRIRPNNCDTVGFELCAASANENKISLTRIKKNRTIENLFEAHYAWNLFS